MRVLVGIGLMLGVSLAGNHVHPASAHDGGGKSLGIGSLDVYADGDAKGARLHVLTADYGDGKSPHPVLKYSGSADSGKSWTASVIVGAGQPPAHGAMRGMDPQIAASGDHVIAVWMTPGTDAYGGGPMATALSHDGGKTWTPGPNPADDGSTTGHGFLDIIADKDGAFSLTWLDTRGEKRGLRYARSTDQGKTWSANTTPDAETCECCWNALATAPDGATAILYRDKSPRDMAVSVTTDQGKTWPASVPAGTFHWEFPGCPHAGGGLAFRPANQQNTAPTLHAVVWTGHTDHVGIYHVSSADQGRNWSTPQSIAGSLGTHPSLAVNGKGQLAAAWDAHEDPESGVIKVAQSVDNGQTWEPLTRLRRQGVMISHPLIVGTPDGFRLFWTESTANGAGTWQSQALP